MEHYKLIPNSDNDKIKLQQFIDFCECMSTQHHIASEIVDALIDYKLQKLIKKTTISCIQSIDFFDQHLPLTDFGTDASTFLNTALRSPCVM